MVGPIFFFFFLFSNHSLLFYCSSSSSSRILLVFIAVLLSFLYLGILGFCKYLIQSILLGNTHTEDSYVGVHTSELMKEANKYIKRCVGAGSNVSLLFCGSVTTGAIKRLQEVMGISASPPLHHRLLESIAADERWVIFLGPYEHHSNLLSWKQTVAEVHISRLCSFAFFYYDL